MNLEMRHQIAVLINFDALIRHKPPQKVSAANELNHKVCWRGLDGRN